MVSQKDTFSLKSSDASAPRLYGLPKIYRKRLKLTSFNYESLFQVRKK